MKKTAIKQLAALHNQSLDLRPIMEKSVLKGWIGFFADDRSQPYKPSEKTSQEQRNQVERELAEQLAERERKTEPPPDKPDIEQNKAYQGIQQFLKKKRRK